VQRSDLGTQPSARTPLLAQATNPAVRGAPAAVPRPAGAPGSVPRPPGAPSGVPRPGGAPSARPPHVAPPPPPPLEVDEPVEPEATTEPTDIPAQAPTRPSFVAPAAVSAAPPLRRLIIPETGAIERVSPQQIAELKRLFGQFAQFDYFQVLQLAPTATTVEIKRAFYKESRIYHPDRIFHLDDAAAKQHFGELYRRITEAYYVLRDDAKRKKYLADLAGPERANKLRFTEASEFEQKAEVVKAREEEFGTNPKARQFFKTALADIAASKWDVALRNIKMALTFEPSNPRFKEKLALVEAKVEEQRKATHTGFTIK
jgi:DnaJ-domain-containing protein 1